MYVLLNICLVLYPQRIDESVSVTLQQKLGDSMNKMQRGEASEFENSFNFGCPKFLSPIATIHEIDTLASSGFKDKFEISKQQLDVFMEEIRQQLPILNIRNYLKLYTTMPIIKLASFLEIEEKELKLLLLAYKQKMNNLISDASGKPGLTGKFVSSSDIDFYIDKGMIHIADTKVERRYGDFFLKQINSFEDMFGFVSTLKLQAKKKIHSQPSATAAAAPVTTTSVQA